MNMRDRAPLIGVLCCKQQRSAAKEAAAARQLRAEAEARAQRAVEAHAKEEAAHQRVLAKARRMFFLQL